MGKSWLGDKFPALSKLSGALSFGGATAIGLSIGSSSIKLVELKKAGSQWKLMHFGVIQLPEDSIVNREITNSIAVVESLKSLTAQMKLKGRAVCSGISGTSIIIKRISIEVPNPKELQEQVFWEAEQYLPFDPSEVVMDFHVLSKAKEKMTDVILVAVKRSVLDSYISCIEDAGFSAKFADVDFFALQNVFEINYPQSPSEAVLLVDIGSAAMKLAIVQGGVPIFTKDVALGGNSITQEIMKQLNLSHADAEALKVGGQAQGMPEEVSELLGVMSENFAVEIKRALDFYGASSSGAPVSYVLLSGGSASIAGLSKVVEDTIGLPTQVMNPFNAITYDPEVFSAEYIQAIGPVASVPLGLALRAGGGT